MIRRLLALLLTLLALVAGTCLAVESGEPLATDVSGSADDGSSEGTSDCESDEVLGAQRPRNVVIEAWDSPTPWHADPHRRVYLDKEGPPPRVGA